MDKNFNEYKKLLAEFVKFKSVSTDPAYLPEIGKTVAWLENLLKKSGFKTQVWKGNDSNPVVFGEYLIDKKLPTVLVYGHYDVQPAEKSDGWTTEPYTLTETKKKLLARGVVDNKGQIIAHIATVIRLIKEKKLVCNVKFLIEGNEETGNPDLPATMKEKTKALKCDVVVVSDGELTNNKPTIEVSLRGGINMTLIYKTGKNNLHSGLFGGAVPNASQELMLFLSKLFNADNTVNFKEFYKGVDKITPDQKTNNVRLTKQAGDLAKLAGVKTLLGIPNLDFYSLTGLTPTMQITGIKTGYIGEGYANIIPAEAEVRINIRTVASQKSKAVAKAFEKYVKTNTPKYVDYKLSFNGFHDPVKVNVENKFVPQVEEMLTKIYKTQVNRRNVGGAIPFVGDVKELLGVDTLLIPLVNEDCNMHGTDENFDIELAKKALAFSEMFFTTIHLYSDWSGTKPVVRKKKN